MNLFDTEKDLVDTFSRKYKKFLKDVVDQDRIKPFQVHEFDSKFGVADIVIGTFLPDSRISSRKPMNENWVATLSKLKLHDEFTLSSFAKNEYVSENYARKILNQFEQSGYVKKLRPKHYELMKEYNVQLQKTVAIEAKLKNWKRALDQAYRYRHFSNYSFVLLDEKHTGPAIKNIEKFKALNIGLASMGKKMSILFKPKENKTQLNKNLFRLNEYAVQSHSIS